MLTTTQLQTLRTACFNDPTAAAFFAAPGDAAGLRTYLNTSSAFIVWKKLVTTDEVGNAVNYIAVEAMTDANRGRITTFYAMNPVQFEPRADVRTYWENTFSGALGGQGQATRDALAALWRRSANNVERLLATGTGSTSLPGALTFEGDITEVEAVQLIYKDDGTIWTAQG